MEDVDTMQMRYPEFILSLEALAMIGYSRHPYGDMRMTSEDKMERLLILMVTHYTPLTHHQLTP